MVVALVSHSRRKRHSISPIHIHSIPPFTFNHHNYPLLLPFPSLAPSLIPSTHNPPYSYSTRVVNNERTNQLALLSCTISLSSPFYSFERLVTSNRKTTKPLEHPTNLLQTTQIPKQTPLQNKSKIQKEKRD